MGSYLLRPTVAYYYLKGRIALMFSKPHLLHSDEAKQKELWNGQRRNYTIVPKRIFGFDIYLNSDPNDFSLVSRSIGLHGYWELPATVLFRKIVKGGMTVIGANIGYYTLMAARLVGEHGKVFAFEPFPGNVGFLEKSLERNRFRNVMVFDDALSDKEGSVQLSLSPTAIGQHSIAFDKGGGRITVKSRTLDQFAEEQALERVDLIKIDAEGAEPMILSGGLNLLSKYRPHVIMEYDPIVWRQQSRLLDWVNDFYHVYQITRFPFLLRSRGLGLIPSLSLTNLFLEPRS